MRNNQPLAYRMRPTKLDDYVGQKHIIGESKIINKLIDNDELFSIVFFGPPGVGKTTLAKIIASSKPNLTFFELSAVESGVKEIKTLIAKNQGHNFILFLDEIHRFNKAQQDILLPYIESNQIILIGATTENPKYYLNNALISRLMIIKLCAPSTNDIKILIKNALSNDDILKLSAIKIEHKVIDAICEYSNNDCRKALNIMDRMWAISSQKTAVNFDNKLFEQAVGEQSYNFNKMGLEFHDQLSAFHKSIRGSNPDAAIFWLVSMLENGVNPLVVARRMLCIASEDIGNADPNALRVANDAWNAFEKIGMPEGKLPLSQAAIYLAIAPKSNACYLAFNKATQAYNAHNDNNVPANIKQHNFGKYIYPHDYPNSFVKQDYLPKHLKNAEFYNPNENGFEAKIKKKWDAIKNIFRA